MAFLPCPHRLRPSHSVAFFSSTQRECRRLLSFRCIRATAAVREEKGGAAVVWFKRDLRLDDHPGLVAAASRHRAVVPLYVFDRRILRYLRKELKDQGSDLLIAFGSAEDEILKIVNKVNATHIFAEEEVEHNFRQVITLVKSSLSAVPFSSGNPEFISWNTPFYSIQYTVVGHEGPAVLLVHGFGAFLEHYRDNISAIANDGHRVWAITLLGFGKSEKPNIRYTELLWAELLRDFIVDVIGEPVHLVGNSIGGYFVAAVAGLWPALVKTAVLMNSAGSVIPGYMSVSLTDTGTSSGIAGIGARILLLFLRLRVEKILRNYYPSNPGRADKTLIKEMLRSVSSYNNSRSWNSDDPGVLIVLESVFDFSLSIPLNYLLESFGGKVLVIQGMKDPLSKSKQKLDMLREHCDRVVIKELDAGHCPHDECPELVNSIITEWTKATS
ncbi:hypothetical protein Taro_020417 [Colocasia esculenta]|uniref:Photolyase/cryptochrome alpha/beta domain-containing protein n=1 Tax=Colocasia esculenta TaxID=4460 RepID=A0A843UYQ1_COLES|nr:hypothetical protein [Colocasia esculenta]